MVPRYGTSPDKFKRALMSFLAAWNIGCSFAQNEAQLIAFRLLAGLGGSAPLSVCLDVL